MTVTKHRLGAADYTVIAGSLLLPVLIGFIFRFSGGRQKTTNEFLLAGRDSSMIPAVMSTSVTILSAIAMLGLPSEIYRFGPQYTIAAVSISIGMLLASKIFLPVYFQCNVTSIYEFLEKRFGKWTRYTISGIFILQILLYSSAVLWGPVLALSTVTDISTDWMIIICGAVCTFYCFLGGLKAVLWTDTLQSVLMIACLVTIYAVGITEVGSVAEIFRRAGDGNRLGYFNLEFDLTTRFTFWNTFLYGLNFGIAMYGTNQIQLQRSFCLSNLRRAQRSLQWSTVIVFGIFVLCYSEGLLLYAVFYLCDPVLSNKISKHDQIVPYFIVSRLKNYPGLTGLCFSGIFSGSLSTISSALNSLSTVTVVDFLQPLLGDKLTPTREIYTAKFLCFLYGAFLVAFTFSVAGVDSISQATTLFINISQGPVLAIFLIGVLTRKGTDKCAMFGFMVGVFLVSWIALGTLLSGYVSNALPLETSRCSVIQNSTQTFQNLTSTCNFDGECEEISHSNTFILHKVSYLWVSTIGFITTFVVVLLASYATGGKGDVTPSDSKYFSPIVRVWSECSIFRPRHGKEVVSFAMEEQKTCTPTRINYIDDIIY